MFSRSKVETAYDELYQAVEFLQQNVLVACIDGDVDFLNKMRKIKPFDFGKLGIRLTPRYDALE